MEETRVSQRGPHYPHLHKISTAARTSYNFGTVKYSCTAPDEGVANWFRSARLERTPSCDPKGAKNYQNTVKTKRTSQRRKGLKRPQQYSGAIVRLTSLFAVMAGTDSSSSIFWYDDRDSLSSIQNTVLHPKLLNLKSQALPVLPGSHALAQISNLESWVFQKTPKDYGPGSTAKKIMCIIGSRVQDPGCRT